MKLIQLNLKRIFFLSIITCLIYSCQFTDENEPKDLNLANLSIEGDFGFKDSYSFNYKNEEDLKHIMHQIWLEGTEATQDENTILKYQLSLNPVDQTLTLSHIQQEKFVKNGAVITESALLPITISKCPEGWDSVATCFSEDCVANNLAEVFADVNSAGTCMRAQVSRTLFNATVCSQPC